ncbi:scopoletin glucosyltransferase-like [Telopea speciosissima]|uniref:scopoletin glucosyltransferase-like n=1 Tax=Telopea speciosissima TaxID=54955 RepID=UPI001CC6F2F3|nr:scopoletin glucosyltransferase-like [Telopea speciosissima]
MGSPAPPHIVIFPFMAYGHIIPFLDLSKALTHRNIKITIITTPGNASFIQKHISKYPQIHLSEIPFPITQNLPKGCENTAQLPSIAFYFHFLEATKQLQEPFHQLLQNMSQSNDLPICVISDFFLGWTLPVCCEFSVPRLVFHGMGVFALAMSKTVSLHTPHLHVSSDTVPLNLPGFQLHFTMTRSDVPEMFFSSDPDNPIIRLISEAGQHEMDSWGVIVNSFMELEGPYVPTYESFFVNGAKSWCVGPLILYDPPAEPV